MTARAGVHTPVSACASGAKAIGYAIEMIRSGRADVWSSPATLEAAIIPLNIAAFAAMRALSTRNDEPERASRPFDKGRDGFLLGEGAGMVVLESAAHAAARGARVHAVAAGTGLLGRRPSHRPARPGRDRHRARHPAGTRRRRAQPRAGLVHVNAHATSTPAGDTVEGQAIAAALGPAAPGVVVSATKSMTGHLLGGAGAGGGGHHPGAPRPGRPADHQPGRSRRRSRRRYRHHGAGTHPHGSEPMAALNNSFGFGGHNVCLAFTAA